MSNPGQRPAKIDYQVANGASSSEQRNFFFQLMERSPDVTWTSAELDRYAGLTLYREAESGETIALRFTCALCGYYGNGPMTSVEILSRAGFGDREHIEHHVFSNLHYTFAK